MEDHERKTMKDVSDYFRRLQFRKRLIGGVDEMDVLNKLENLQRLYEMVYETQKAWYEGRLKERHRHEDSG
ncbi:hypothetical protein [Faecalibaculum rodentium]|uniref:hypothetical protein n=1 Tax=Faecalibaculum rodentium TaxID=1702221 RepID=UPI0023F1D5E2|nr:hypothetical protein [Faecalibaculum rodentium]